MDATVTALFGCHAFMEAVLNREIVFAKTKPIIAITAAMKRSEGTVGIR